MSSRVEPLPCAAAPDARASIRASIGHHASLAVAVLTAVLLSVAVADRLSVTGDPVVTFSSDLGVDQQRRAAILAPAIEHRAQGYVVPSAESGTVTVSLPLGNTWLSDRRILRLWVYGGTGVFTRAELINGKRSVRDLGRATFWNGRIFDVTAAARAADGRLWLRVTADNRGNADALFFDRMEVIRAGPKSQPGLSTALMTAWIVSLTLSVLLFMRTRRGLMLVVPIAALVAISWPRLRAEAYTPLGPDLAPLWDVARASDWLSLNHGLLWGSFGGESHLTGQLLHAATALVGDGAAGARVASLLLAVLALAGLWWAAGRVAGLTGSVIATLATLAIDGFRAAALADPEIVCLVLVGALWLGALHGVVGARDLRSYGRFAAASALATLVEPLLFPGIVIVLLLVVAIRFSAEHRIRAVGIAALVLALLLLPNRLSVAHQAGGDMFADVSQRAATARVIEFGPPRSKGSGGMSSYVFGDHEFGVAVGGTVMGTYQAFAAIGQRDASGWLGLIVLVAVLAGAAFILCVPLLRWLLLAPIGVALPLAFLADRGIGTPFSAAAFWLPAAVVSAAVLIYALAGSLRAWDR